MNKTIEAMLRGYLQMTLKDIDRKDRTIAALSVENARLREDAERYKKLRKYWVCCWDDEGKLRLTPNSWDDLLKEEKLDAAIDAMPESAP